MDQMRENIPFREQQQFQTNDDDMAVDSETF